MQNSTATEKIPGGQAAPALTDFDIFIIGGGINGCGVARDAAGRGFRVCLAEMNDLASGTSSWSSKLIHGGIRYLEHYEFRLVREALSEREVLLRAAPHIIWPLRFVLPHHAKMRPALMLRAGLFLYDHLGKRNFLPGSKSLDLTREAVGAPLRDMFRKGFEYSDCWVDDARLVVLNAIDARAHGAVIETRMKVTAARFDQGVWTITTEDMLHGTRQERTARIIVNAAGPWVDAVLGTAFSMNDVHHVRLVQGSHIVVAKCFDHDRAYIFQNPDGRIIFALPYEDDFTLIGTTDRDYEGDPGAVRISDEEVDYLCAAASAYFKNPVRKQDIVWSYSGVRPLFDDGASAAQEATREYVIRKAGDGLPLINIFGGKITTFRRLAESALAMVEDVIGTSGPRWTENAVLPGGDFGVTGGAALKARYRATYPALAPAYLERLIRTYGTRTAILLAGVTTSADLGTDFGGGLYRAEVDYLVKHEWALNAEDIAFRRTKRGIRMSDAEIAALDAYLGSGEASATA